MLDDALPGEPAAGESFLTALTRRRTRTLERGQYVDRSLDEVFRFYADPHNLEHITPPFLRFRVAGVSGDRIGDGTRIRYRLRLHGLPVGWTSVIEEWTPNVRFVDRQLHGPYALWHHTHEFEERAGGTEIRDIVRYALPMGALGDALAHGMVRRDLEKIFDYRRDATSRVFAR